MKNKLIVLDDDPTGIQSVHDILVITKPEISLIEEAFLDDNDMFYILTNSRAFNEKQTTEYHHDLMKMIIKVSKKTDIPFTIISRSDSTLRGHYPLETQIIYDEMTSSGMLIDGEIICPYLQDIRKTVNDIHYVLNDNEWIKVGDSEFAKDKSFGFKSSDLKEYVEEKTNGKYKAESCISISLDLLRNHDKNMIADILDNVCNYNKVIVNAENMEDLMAFVDGYELSKKRFIFRCSASLVKCLGHITDIGFLTKEDCIDTSSHGGIIIVGSHVKKTTDQLAYLMQHCENIEYVEFNQHRILDGTLADESERVSNIVNKLLKDDKVVIVATKRERIDFPTDDKAKQLEWANEISEQLVKVLNRLEQRPRFVITKGGITGNDALVKGLEVKKEWVLGQIIRNVGVVSCLEGSKFYRLPVVVFPGNVGNNNSLYEVVNKLIG